MLRGKWRATQFGALALVASSVAGNWIPRIPSAWAAPVIGSPGGTVCLKIEEEARFPQIEGVLPEPEAITSRLQWAPAAAEFALKVLPKLPHDDSLRKAITQANQQRDSVDQKSSNPVLKKERARRRAAAKATVWVRV